MEEIKSFLATLKTFYERQGQSGKILLPGAFLLLFCCLCSIVLLPLRGRNTPTNTPGPVVYPSLDIQATPTALFNFGSTPFPTLVAPSPLPTTPGPPTATQTPAPLPPTETATPVPTNTNPPPTVANTGSVLIVAVNKQAEYVDVQNTGNGPVDLNGWKLVSETGNQACTLTSILQPNEVLRIWARTGSPGLNCDYDFNIWNDNQTDPAVLYDSQGKEISRFP